MKAISASIIVLAGALLMVGGAIALRGYEDFFISTGVIIGVIGLYAWVKEYRGKQDSN